SDVNKCSFINDFNTFCVEELANFIPEVCVIGLKDASYQSFPEEVPTDSQTEDDLKKSCLEKQQKIQIQYENPEKFENLKIIKMKGINVEPGVLRATGRCLKLYPTITTLRLENCNLTYIEIDIIANILTHTAVITDLCLNGNPVRQMNYFILLQETNLQYLSLCLCNINDEGVKLISNELKYSDYTTNTLIGLNLTHNRITCAGVKFLAEALRTNRSVISLSLAGNRIQDQGVGFIAEVLQKFPLFHEECIERRCRNITRLLKRQSFLDEQVKIVKNAQVSSNSKQGIIKSVMPKKTFSASRDTKKGGSQILSSTKRTSATKESNTTLEKRNCKARGEMRKIDLETICGPHHWKKKIHILICRKVTPEDGSLWCVGNFHLSHLNLAYNRFGLVGVKAFHTAVIYQDKLLHNTRRGLLRLGLQGNPIPEFCTELPELLEIINNRYYSINDITGNNEDSPKTSISSVKRRSSSRQSSSIRKSNSATLK
ncbi:hypothetical protein L9F63_006726, partial [Diploptera punctata]